MSSRQSHTAFPYLFLAPSLLLFALFIAYPIAQNIINSLFRFSAISASRDYVGLDNFLRLLGDDVFWTSLLNTLRFAGASVVVQVGLGTVLAAFLHRGVTRLKNTYRFAIFVPMVMSVVAVGLLWTLIYDPIMGLFNQLLSFIGIEARGWLADPDTAIWAIIAAACWQYTGFTMVIVLAGMESISSQLYEAALIDGAGEVKSFFWITVPMVRHVIAVAVLITVIGSFKVFDYVWVMTRGGPAHASEVMTTYMYLLAFTTDRMGLGSAVASYIFGITLTITAFRIPSLRISR